MLVEAEVGKDINTELTNVAAGSDAVRSKLQYWIGIPDKSG